MNTDRVDILLIGKVGQNVPFTKISITDRQPMLYGSCSTRLNIFRSLLLSRSDFLQNLAFFGLVNIIILR